MLSNILDFFGGIWAKLVAGALIIALLAYLGHRIELSYTQDAELKAEKSAHAADIIQANADMVELEQNYKKNIRIVAKQKDEAIKLAGDTSKQLENIRHEKRTENDGVAARVLVDAFDWVRLQPDNYAEGENSLPANSVGANKRYAEACNRVLYQSDVANFLTRQFEALDNCRSKLAGLRNLEKDR